MKGKPFSLFKRGKIYYARFKLPDGTWSTAKSTGHTFKGRAEQWCIEYLQTGNIILRENITLAEFSRDFFSWGGEWATDKKVTGKRITERQCTEKTAILNNRILPELGKIQLSKIDKDTVKQFRNKLYTQGLAGSSINKTLSCMSAILEAAEGKSLIKYVPKIERASDRPVNERGILTMEEVKKLFSVQWGDFRAFTMNLTAASTGLRRGELLALRIQDIKPGYITILHSWDEATRTMNTTKTGRSRTVTIPEAVQGEISRLIDINPYRLPGSFIFFTRVSYKPMEGKKATEGLYNALKAIGIDETERKQRNITFHSWRHWLNSLLINSKIPLQKVQSITGHLTDKMTDHYYHVDDMEDVLKIQRSIYEM